MNAAFTFPTPTGDARHDGLALLHHVIRYGTTPVDLDAVKLALHVAPLAYLGAPVDATVKSVNAAVDTLAAAARRLTGTQAARKARIAALFDGLDDRPNQGPMAPLPTPPVVPTPPSAVTRFEELATELSQKAGINMDEARRLLRSRLTPNGKEAA